MDLSLFATQVAQNGKTALSGNSLSGGNGLFGGGNGLAFWNVILDQLGADGETQLVNANNNQNNAANFNSDGSKPDTIKKEKLDLALLQLALMGQDSGQSIDEKLAKLSIENLGDNKENRIAQLTKLIEHLTNGLPVNADNGNIEDLVSRLEKRLENLESSLDAFRSGNFGDEGAPFKLLIATGLNPAQITKITQRIEEVETKLGRELTVEDLIAGVGNIIPVPGDEGHEFSSADAIALLNHATKEQNSIDTQVETSSETESLSETDEDKQVIIDAFGQIIIDETNHAADISSDLTAAVNNAAPAAPAPVDKQNNAITGQQFINQFGRIRHAPLLDQAAGNAANKTAAGSAPSNETPEINGEELQSMRTNSEFKELFGNNGAVIGKIMKASHSTTPQVKMIYPIANAGDITVPMEWHEGSSTLSTISKALGFDIETGVPFSNTMQAIHAASSSLQAGQTHPATHMVAASLNKAASNGDGKSLVLHLDPPELGRVEVRLEFGKDKSVKASLIVEKPETFLLLQRDAAALERALQNAGLDTSGDSLNFQMAAEDYAFNTGKDGQNGSSNQNSGAGGDAAIEEDVIETNMTWNVDAETGHVHYSIMA